VFFASVAATATMFVSIPKGFFPDEDIGQLSIMTEARQDISFPALVTLQKQVEAAVRAPPYVAHAASIVGNSQGNAGQLFVELKPKGQRPDMPVVLRDLRGALAKIPGISSFISPIQNLRLGGRTSKSQYQLVVQSINQGEVDQAATKIADALSHDRMFRDVTTDLQASATTVRLNVDQAKAESLGIPASTIRAALENGFGSTPVATIDTTGNSYDVLLEFDPDIPWSIERLGQVQLHAASGALVPIASIATLERVASRLTINQNGQLSAVTVSFNLPEGVSLGEASDRIAQIKAGLDLPAGVSTAFAGTAKVFQQSLANQGLLLLAAIATIYVVLGVLYESYIHPLTILSGIPSAAIGAFAALEIMGMDLSMIAVIGLLMLIGIVKKNAIMMVDVALDLQREQGLEAAVAMRRACSLRYRPIMMTTFAALLGALPIAMGAGASAELRQPLGVCVVGGLLVSQLVTLFITPVLFTELERVRVGTRRLVARLRARPAHRAPEPGLAGPEVVQPAE
jgi:HAE1 family hydrophobic/amphiphilic exporter-1